MSLRSTAEQCDFEALRFGPPFTDRYNRSPILDAIEASAKMIGNLVRDALIDDAIEQSAEHDRKCLEEIDRLPAIRSRLKMGKAA